MDYSETLLQKRAQFRAQYPTEKNLNRLAQKIGIGSKIAERWRLEDFNETESPTEKRLRQRAEKRKQRRAEFQRLYLSRKFTLDELAAKLGVSAATVAAWRREFFPLGQKQRYEDFKKAVQNGHGATVEKLAETLGVTRPTVIRYLRRHLDEMHKNGILQAEKLKISCINPASYLRYLHRLTDKTTETG